MFIVKPYQLDHSIDIMSLLTFLQRYASFTFAKVSLLATRWIILMLSLHWLTPSKFAQLAGVLSLVEILRAFSDIGAENIIYARLAESGRPISPIVKSLIRARIVIACLLCIVAILLIKLFTINAYWLLFILLPILAFQNASIAFLQKERNLKQIALLAFSAISVGVFATCYARNAKSDGTLLCLLLILPEAITSIISFFMTKKYWILVISTYNKFRLHRLWPYIGPSAAVSILVMCYSRLDVLLVSPLLGSLDQADYSAGFRLVEPLFLVLALASMSLLAELGALDTPNAKKASIKLMERLNFELYVSMILIACFLGLVVMVFAQKGFAMSLHASYVAAVLAFAIPVKLANTFFSSILQRAGRYNSVLKASSINAVITWLTATIFGMVLGLIGVAIGALIGEIVNFSLQRKAVKLLLFKI
jgi:O-antigen/teichoic acid export membrane protein